MATDATTQRAALAVAGTVAAAGAAMAIWSNRHRRRLPPGPFAWPLIGASSILQTKGSDSYYLLDKMKDKYGPMATLWLGPVPMVCVLDSKLVQDTLCNKSVSDRGYQPYSIDYFTEGLNDIFAAPNDVRWRLHRKLAQSSFRLFAQGEQLENSIINAFDSCASEFESDEPKDLFETLYLVTYNLQGGIVLGRNFDPNDNDLKHLRKTLDEANDLFFSGLPADWLPILAYLPLPSHRKLHELSSKVFDWAKKVCQQHRDEFDPDNLKDVLDFFIHEKMEADKNGDGHLLKEVHLRQTLLDIFFAGTDTTTFTLYYAIRGLASYPKMQQRCFEEIAQVFGNDGTPTLSKRDQLPYTDAFLHEVQRYWTLGTIIPRACNEDITIGGYFLPKGTTIMNATVCCHNDPKIFPNPDTFDPNHFLEADGKKLAAYKRGFLPFGAGVRVCPGEAIAKKSTFLLLVLMVQRFQFSWEQDDCSRGFADICNLLFVYPKRFSVNVKRRM